MIAPALTPERGAAAARSELLGPLWRTGTSRIWSTGTTAIRERVAEYGLDCYPQEFEICDHGQMLGYMAYHGMPAHYPHWSYGKSYEKIKTMYDHGVVGLPYEMVINSNPVPRLSDARQLAVPADPDDRARLRPQRLLQEQLHVHQRDARRPDARSVQGARRSRPRLRRGSLDRPRARRKPCSTPRTRCR